MSTPPLPHFNFEGESQGSKGTFTAPVAAGEGGRDSVAGEIKRALCPACRRITKVHYVGGKPVTICLNCPSLFDPAGDDDQGFNKTQF